MFVGRCNLETIEKSTTKFIDLFCEKLFVHAWHDFITNQQWSFLKEIEKNLTNGECTDFLKIILLFYKTRTQTSDQTTAYAFACFFYKKNICNVTIFFVG